MDPKLIIYHRYRSWMWDIYTSKDSASNVTCDSRAGLHPSNTQTKISAKIKPTLKIRILPESEPAQSRSKPVPNTRYHSSRSVSVPWRLKKGLGTDNHPGCSMRISNVIFRVTIWTTTQSINIKPLVWRSVHHIYCGQWNSCSVSTVAPRSIECPAVRKFSEIIGSDDRKA